MEKRNILDINGHIVGELELPDGTPEDIWAEKLNQFKTNLTVDASLATKFTIKERKEFADQLLEEFKARNIADGITAIQALWMHHRMRALPVTIGGLPMVLDILNMAISGDVETACIALQYTEADDMTMPYHWLNAERIAWIVSKMKNYLGWA